MNLFLNYVMVGLMTLAFFMMYQRARGRRLTNTTAIDERLAKLEQRIENLETIVIERDKKSEFEKL